MFVNRVTITGADDNTDPVALRQIQDEFPFVEWGILMSPKKQGEPRYPSLATVQKFIDEDLVMSYHFCGNYARMIVEYHDYRLIEDMPPYAFRFQVNYNFSGCDYKNSIERLTDLSFFLSEKGRTYLPRKAIFQYNVNNESYLRPFINNENFNFLQDGSGGRGLHYQCILFPSYGEYRGVAGGINPDNVEETCKAIKSVNNYNNKYGFRNMWIDIESGARTDNKLDLLKVRNILTTCKDYTDTSCKKWIKK